MNKSFGIRTSVIFLIFFLFRIAENHALGQEIPVLCYHQVRNHEQTDSKTARPLIAPPKNFAAQMKMLADSGYKTILPQQMLLLDKRGIAPSSKLVVITFDDGTASQFDNAVPILEKYHFKAVFFIMTVSLNHSIYMTGAQVKMLSDKGYLIGCHTWDHHNVITYTNGDWKLQLEDPKVQLEKITGLPVEYFAYPYGAWDDRAIEKLKSLGYKAAFQLSGRRSAAFPQYTLRRIIVNGDWTGKQLLSQMKASFK